MDSLAFYKNVSALEGVELMQGSLIIERPHYEKREQLMCLIDGVMDIFIIPHVQRQEVYAGEGDTYYIEGNSNSVDTPEF